MRTSKVRVSSIEIEIVLDTPPGVVTAIIPEGSISLGTIRHPSDRMMGCLARYKATGVYVHVASGVVRTLPQAEAADAASRLEACGRRW